jgi:hypothetical protein
MALSKSVASELLEAFRAGEGVDLIRESVRLVMQDLIEVDAAEQIGPSFIDHGRISRVQDKGDVPDGDHLCPDNPLFQNQDRPVRGGTRRSNRERSPRPD